MKGIYIAAKFESRERIKAEREKIHAIGAGRVIGTWLDEEGTGTPDAASAEQYALRDAQQIAISQLLILDTLDDNLRGGREVECGIAIGCGVEVWVVGPRRNVFHYLCPHFATWDDVHDQLAREVAA